MRGQGKHRDIGIAQLTVTIELRASIQRSQLKHFVTNGLDRTLSGGYLLLKKQIKRIKGSKSHFGPQITGKIHFGRKIIVFHFGP